MQEQLNGALDQQKNRKISLLGWIYGSRDVAMYEAILNYNINVNNLAGVLILKRCADECVFIARYHGACSCCPILYAENVRTVVKKIYGATGYIIQKIFLKMYPECADIVQNDKIGIV